MAETPNTLSDEPRGADDPDVVAATPAVHGVAAPSTLEGDGGEIIVLLEETSTIAKRRRATGRVRISTRTEVVRETAEAALDRYRVEVTRVPVGRIVDAVPAARAEGDTTIVPVVEERLVVVKQLFLVEEVHIRHVLEREAVSQPVMLRRQRAIVERFDPPDDGTVPDGTASRRRAASHVPGRDDGSVE